MEYKLRFTDITTLRPYMFAVGGALWGCIVAWLLINYVSHNLFYWLACFVLRCRLRVNSASAYIL